MPDSSKSFARAIDPDPEVCFWSSSSSVEQSAPKNPSKLFAIGGRFRSDVKDDEMEVGDYARISLRLSLPPSFLRLFISSFSHRIFSVRLFLHENSNLRFEQTLRTLAEERSSNEWQCARPFPLFLQHLCLSLSSLLTWESAIHRYFSLPILGGCTHEASVYAFSLHYLSLETFSSARLAGARYVKVLVVQRARPIAITRRTEWKQPFATPVLYCHPLNFFNVLLLESAIVKRRAAQL